MRRLPLPSTASQVTALARENDLDYTTFWGSTRDANPFYRVSLARRGSHGRTYLHAIITWHKDPMTGTLKMDTKVYRTTPWGAWRDVKDLRTLAELIAETPVRAKTGPKTATPSNVLVGA